MPQSLGACLWTAVTAPASSQCRQDNLLSRLWASDPESPWWISRALSTEAKAESSICGLGRLPCWARAEEWEEGDEINLPWMT